MKNHYNTIANAIEFIQRNAVNQPSLKQIAQHVHLSESHLQRVFTNWAGVSPKQFLKFINIQYTKQLLQQNLLQKQQLSILETSEQSGFLSSSRLHDLFVTIEGMTPAQYKNLGDTLSIEYEFYDTLFGNLLVASTHIGICYMGFNDDKNSSLKDLNKRFIKANFIQKTNVIHLNVLKIFQDDWQSMFKIKLHLKGTDFQLKVWQVLLQIPTATLTTYGTLAHTIGKPKASRAVGSAIGKNPIAFLIPCHRVIQQSGLIGGYKWGSTRKSAIIGLEASQQ
ncbi:MAG: methylated-DNA--[protein]-cysteine S-methyltransferase [Saccharospirillaceae bacterium]|nr:methylated-DNA--[protein]-cysteine S-methyltransferase [Pseudomonadales bacterium]NRB79025.1 methylated-DNA--[protein]-cysteine S-methyltransferase [Saccharospirillaceae bacterium]